MLAAGIFMFVPGTGDPGVDLFTSRQVILNVVLVWGMAVYGKPVPPNFNRWNWIENFYNQALIIRAMNRPFGWSQPGVGGYAHINRQLSLANEKQLSFRIMAEEAEKTKAAFVAKVSHEFRNPAEHGRLAL
jgi:signal transduction histidine kinase